MLTRSTIRRRLLIAVAVAAPLAWLLSTSLTYLRAAAEINELYDTDMVRMAQLVQTLTRLLPIEPGDGTDEIRAKLLTDAIGNAGLDTVSVSTWTPRGTPIHIDTGAMPLPLRPGEEGFVDLTLQQVRWRVFYLNNVDAGWRVAVGQLEEERDELITGFLTGQIAPTLIGLPLLMIVLAFAIRRALAPIQQLSEGIGKRAALDPTPIPTETTPLELRPLLAAMNDLIHRDALMVERERHFIADAAHELRTPLAALKSQWEAAALGPAPAGDLRPAGQAIGDTRLSASARQRIGMGIDRLERVVSQLLALSRLEGHLPATFEADIQWSAVVEVAVSDCWALARARDVSIEVQWPASTASPLPLAGNSALLTMLLRNLLDNAVRYNREGGRTLLRLEVDAIEVVDEGEGVSPHDLDRLENRFFRAGKAIDSGSGLGLSIARRIADLHGLTITYQNVERDGAIRGMRIRLARR